jgi:hypothetical protein
LTQKQKDEIDVLNASIENRQKSIVLLEADVKTTRLQAQSFESRARTLQSQNENLFEEMRKITQALAAKEAGLNPDRVQTVDPNKPNPPAVQVNGKIEKVEAGFVQLSLGTDHGLKKNHTLDVYRLQPEPKYLGMVRIVDANFHNSVGRLIPSGNVAFRTPLREGDLVTSTLTK